MRIIRNRQGAAAAEFALVLPVLTVMLFGVFQYGILIFTYASMEDAARNAARALAVCGVATLDDATKQTPASLPPWVPAADFIYALPKTNDPLSVAYSITLPDPSNATFLNLVPMPQNITASVTMRLEPLSFGGGTCLQQS